MWVRLTTGKDPRNELPPIIFAMASNRPTLSISAGRTADYCQVKRPIYSSRLEELFVAAINLRIVLAEGTIDHDNNGLSFNTPHQPLEVSSPGLHDDSLDMVCDTPFTCFHLQRAWSSGCQFDWLSAVLPLLRVPLSCY